MRLALHCFVLCFVFVAGALGSQRDAAERQAIDAYRAEDYASAAAWWRQALEAATGDLEAGEPRAGDRERARLMTNLGNCAARQDDWAGAAAWFEASLRLRPRDGDTRDKLDFARSEAGWPPLDRGDLASSTARLLGAFTEDEARWIALLGLLPLCIALAGEALRGSRGWRQASIACALLWLLLCAPCMHSSWKRDADPVLVISPSGAAARSEPRDSSERLERLPAGERFERLDELPDWTKLLGPEGRAVWVPSRDVFALER